MIKTLRPKKGVYVTHQGLADARSELILLKKDKRKEIAERIQKAREYGDLTENSEYDAALEEQTLIENRIAELEGVLKNAMEIQEIAASDSVVIGSTIFLELDGQKDEFTIVGRVEADPSKKRISNESPLGSSLLGSKIGEVVEVKTPAGSYRAKVISIK